MNIDLSTSNLDKISDPSGEAINPSEEASYLLHNQDDFYAENEGESIIVGASFISTNNDKFDSAAISYAESITPSLEIKTLNVDNFQSLSDQTEETLEQDTIEWVLSSVTATEITDPSKSLGMMLNKTISDDSITASFQVLNTSTAENITEYLITGNGAGTVNFDGGLSIIKNLDFQALTQVFAKPLRTVDIVINSVTGNGTYWPKIIISAPVTSGYIYIFDRYLYWNTDFVTGSSKEDQATIIAAAWNFNPNYQFYSGNNPGVGAVYVKATAVAIGNMVEFRLDESLAVLDYSFIFQNNMNNASMKGNLIGSYYHYLAAPNRRDTWTLSVGAKNILTVSIAAHGVRAGVVSVFSYDAVTRRVTKRGQVPSSSVFGLNEKLEEFSNRLKNKGY